MYCPVFSWLAHFVIVSGITLFIIHEPVAFMKDAGSQRGAEAQNE